MKLYQSDIHRLVSSICVRLWGTGGRVEATNAKVPQDKQLILQMFTLKRDWGEADEARLSEDYESSPTVLRGFQDACCVLLVLLEETTIALCDLMI